jgi:hypothetical protein
MVPLVITYHAQAQATIKRLKMVLPAPVFQERLLDSENLLEWFSRHPRLLLAMDQQLLRSYAAALADILLLLDPQQVDQE